MRWYRHGLATFVAPDPFRPSTVVLVVQQLRPGRRWPNHVDALWLAYALHASGRFCEIGTAATFRRGRRLVYGWLTRRGLTLVP